MSIEIKALLGFLIMGIAFLLIMFTIWKTRSTYNDEYHHHEVRKPIHKFSDEEILSGDIRNPSVQNEILSNRPGRQAVRIDRTLKEAQEIINSKKQ